MMRCGDAGLRFGWGSGSGFDTPAVVSSLNDITVVGETVEQRGGHLRVPEYGRPLTECEVGSDDDGSLLVELADQMEQQLAAGLREWQVSEFIEERGGSGNGPGDRFPDERSRAASDVPQACPPVQHGPRSPACSSDRRH